MSMITTPTTTAAAAVRLAPTRAAPFGAPRARWTSATCAARASPSSSVASSSSTSSSSAASASALTSVSTRRPTRAVCVARASRDDDIIDAMGAPGEDARAPAREPAVEPTTPPTPTPTRPEPKRAKASNARRADSTDAVATFMTRRFGLKGGLAWLGVLTFGVVSEQVKTRRETREAIENTRDVDARERREVATPSGASYVELVVGGGERVAPQYLCAAHVRVTNTSTGEVVFDTRAKGRQVVWSYGGRLGGAITRGVEDGVAGMRQGGRRVIKVPAALAFGDDGAVLGDAIVRPGTDLTYDVELTRVSIPPS